MNHYTLYLELPTRAHLFCMYLLILIDVLLHAHTKYYQCKMCWNKTLTFGVGSIQLSFRTIVFTQYMQRCFQSKCYYIHFSQIVVRVCTLVLFINPRRASARVTVLVNPRRACARVTVLVLSVCLCVCLCVCFPYSGTSRNQANKQQYQRLQRDTGMKYKKGFFFKTLRSEDMASFTHLE